MALCASDLLAIRPPIVNCWTPPGAVSYTTLVEVSPKQPPCRQSQEQSLIPQKKTPPTYTANGVPQAVRFYGVT